MNPSEIALLVALAFPILLQAQTQRISGSVTNADGEPLIAATVLVKGGDVGDVTDLTGRYVIDVPDGGEILVFEYVGYSTLEVAIDGRSSIDVQMEPSISELNEVVVIGFGTQSRKRVNSSISSVSEEVFEKVPVSDVQNALQGRMAGVVFTNTSGTTNSESAIRIRGVGSISGGNQPLIVVDGLILSGRITAPYYNSFGFNTNPLINLNPNDIESVEVLKDAAAAAIYGSRGSNGVILITTKSGKFNSQPKVHIGYWAGFSEPSNVIEMLDGQEWAESWNQAALNAGYTPQNNPGFFFDVNSQPSTDWVDLSTQRGFEQEANASVSGGNQSTKYYFGGTMRNEEGMVKTTHFDRYSVRANIDQLIGEKVTAGIGIAPSRVQNRRQDGLASPFYNTIYTPPNVEAFDENGDPVGFAELGGQGSPYANLVESWNDITSTQVLFNSYLSYAPVSNVHLKTTFAVESTQLKEQYKFGSNTLYGFSTGYGSQFEQDVFNYNWTTLGTWDQTFGQRHELDVTAGFHLTKETIDGVYQDGVGFADDALLYIGSASQLIGHSSIHTEAAFAGLLARANYAFADKYLLTISARYDGSSRFGAENRYGFFPAVSAGWVLSDEDFLQAGFIDFLKLRSSYGVAGNAEIGDFAWRGLTRFGQNYNGLPGYDVLNIENEELGWERNVQWDIGLDFALLNDRIRGSLAYYIKNTKDLLLEVPVPTTNGFTTITENIGEVRNQGFEFEVEADLFRGPFSWTIQANGATLKNEVLKLADVNGDGVDDEIYTDSRFLFRPGYSIGTFYLVEYAGVDPSNGDALFWNADGTEKLANFTPESNRRIVGKSIPDFTGGLTNQLKYKNLVLTAFFQFKTGYQLYQLDYGVACSGVWAPANAYKECADAAWTPENPNTDVPQNRLFQLNGAQRSSRNVHDGDYVRLRNITLGYHLPPFGARNTRLYLYTAAQNLWMLTSYPGLDPDAGIYPAGQAEQGSILSPPPAKRTYTLGLNLDF